MNERRELLVLTQSEQLLASIATPQDADDVIRLAEAARVYAQQARLSISIVNHATVIKLRAERRMANAVDEGQAAGKIATPEAGRPGSVRSADTSTLPELGVNRRRLAEARKIRDAYSDDDIQDLGDDASAANKPLSRRQVLKSAKPAPEPAPLVELRSAPADLREGDYRHVLAHVRTDLIFTSPPYNIGSKQARVDGARKFGLYDGKSFGAIRDYPDNLPEDEYQDQQAAFLIWCADHLTDDGVLAYNHKPRRRDKRMIHPAEWFLRPEVRQRLILMEEIIWDRGSTHNHGRQLMWPQTERIYIFRKPSGAYRLDNIAPMPQQADIWRIDRELSPNDHNAPFPTALAKAVILAWSRPGDHVCDPYMGSGSTAIAALSTDRAFTGAEILAKYFEQARKRLAHAGFTNISANQGDGST